MSKTILAQVNGFTPVIDNIADELGIISAVVFGLIWRYCQMQDGVCNATLEKIAGRSGLNKASVMRHAKRLCEAGYLIDHTPELRNVPHTYSDTGKAGLNINITVAQSNATVAQDNKSVAGSKLKKDSKKDSKENEDVPALAQISRAYESEIGVLTPMIADELREASTKFITVWIIDAIHEAAVQNKRGWKYVLAILTRWKAQGNQEQMKPQQQSKNFKPRASEPKAFEAIRQWASKQEELKDVI